MITQGRNRQNPLRPFYIRSNGRTTSLRGEKISSPRSPFGALEVTTENVDGPEPVMKPANDKPVFEVVTPIWGRAPPGYRASSGEEFTAISDGRFDRVSFKDSISKVGQTSLIIYSQPLLDAIRQSVKYFPRQTLTGNQVQMEEPYPVLIHHLDELEELQEQLDRKYEFFSHAL